MISIPEMAILGAAALIFFGPEQLPKVARQVGILMRDVQNTSQSFIREMERAADHSEPAHVSYESPVSDGPAAVPEATDVPLHDPYHEPSLFDAAPAAPNGPAELHDHPKVPLPPADSAYSA